MRRRRATLKRRNETIESAADNSVHPLQNRPCQPLSKPLPSQLGVAKLITQKIVAIVVRPDENNSRLFSLRCIFEINF